MSFADLLKQSFLQTPNFLGRLRGQIQQMNDQEVSGAIEAMDAWRKQAEGRKVRTYYWNIMEAIAQHAPLTPKTIQMLWNRKVVEEIVERPHLNEKNWQWIQQEALQKVKQSPHDRGLMGTTLLLKGVRQGHPLEEQTREEIIRLCANIEEGKMHSRLLKTVLLDLNTPPKQLQQIVEQGINNFFVAELLLSHSQMNDQLAREALEQIRETEEYERSNSMLIRPKLLDQVLIQGREGQQNTEVYRYLIEEFGDDDQTAPQVLPHLLESNQLPKPLLEQCVRKMSRWAARELIELLKQNEKLQKQIDPDWLQRLLKHPEQEIRLQGQRYITRHSTEQPTRDEASNSHTTRDNAIHS